jgi:hypothetical protein
MRLGKEKEGHEMSFQQHATPGTRSLSFVLNRDHIAEQPLRQRSLVGKVMKRHPSPKQ